MVADSLISLLRSRAVERPHVVSYRFLRDGDTEERARRDAPGSLDQGSLARDDRAQIRRGRVAVRVTDGARHRDEPAGDPVRLEELGPGARLFLSEARFELFEKHVQRGSERVLLDLGQRLDQADVDEREHRVEREEVRDPLLSQMAVKCTK